MSFRGCWSGGSMDPQWLWYEFFCKLQNLKTANQLWNVEITWFLKPRNAPNHILELRHGPDWTSLRHSPKPLAGGDGACCPQNHTQSPFSALLASHFSFSGLLSQSRRLARPPANQWLKWRFCVPGLFKLLINLSAACDIFCRFRRSISYGWCGGCFICHDPLWCCQ